MHDQPGISKDVGFNKGAHLSDQTRSPFAAAGITGCAALQPLISLGSQRPGQKGLLSRLGLNGTWGGASRVERSARHSQHTSPRPLGKASPLSEWQSI
jgi:hypothetical protein